MKAYEAKETFWLALRQHGVADVLIEKLWDLARLSGSAEASKRFQEQLVGLSAALSEMIKAAERL